MHVVRETSKIGETPENAIPELLLASLRYGGAKKPSLLLHKLTTTARATGARLRNPSGSHQTAIQHSKPNPKDWNTRPDVTTRR